MTEQQWLDQVLAKLDKKMEVVAERSAEKMPFTSQDGMHDDRSGSLFEWTNGFWGGMMWLMYLMTQKEKYRNLAEQNEVRLDGAFSFHNRLDHDVGFMWMPTAGLHYKLDGNKDSFLRLYYAACHLAGRFHLNGRFIQAWDFHPKCVTIIDCLFNIPLLYLMAEELGESRYKQMAMAHADTVLSQHLRSDGSVIHIVTHDGETGAMTGHLAGQGYDENSAWSRGQAWAVYGFVISYMHTGEQRYLDAAKRAANYFLAACSEDFLPRCDFRAPAEPVVYDASAGAIAACGMLDIAKHCGDLDAEKYRKGAIRLLRAMEEHFCDWSEDTDFILKNCSRRYGVMEPNGRNIPIIFGDYYFLEALVHLKDSEFKFW